jgi:hypothetical protein
VLADEGVSASVSICRTAFSPARRRVRRAHFDLEGNLISREEFERASRMAADDGRSRVRAQPDASGDEPGKIANWIAPPATGIKGKPFEFEYVRLVNCLDLVRFCRLALNFDSWFLLISCVNPRLSAANIKGALIQPKQTTISRTIRSSSSFCARGAHLCREELSLDLDARHLARDERQPGRLYHYCKSKEELLFLIQDNCFGRVLERFEERLQEVEDPFESCASSSRTIFRSSPRTWPR